MLCKVRTDLIQAFRFGVGTVSAGSAVDMDIHKAGQSGHTAHIPALAVYDPDSLDSAVFEFQIGNFFFKNLIIKANIFNYYEMSSR